MGLFIFGFFATGSQVHASFLSNALLKIENFSKEIIQSKSNLKASVSDSSIGITSAMEIDLTPRISYWWGKVNQHMDVVSGTWQTDPDGFSGANINKLTYCKKWYPNTTSVVEYKNETINSWHNAGNVSDYTSTKMSYKCVEENSVTTTSTTIPPVTTTTTTPVDINCISGGAPKATVISPNGGEVYEAGQKVLVKWTSCNWDPSRIVMIAFSSSLVNGSELATTLNDGEEIITIPSTGGTGNLPLLSGKYYKISVAPGGNNLLGDLSDNTFTINQPVSSTPSITVLSPNGGEIYKVGDKIKISLSGGLYMTRVGLIYLDFNPNKEISDGNDVHWLSVTSDAGKSFIWNGSSFIDNDGNKNYWNAGTGNYKIVAIRDVNSNKCYKNKISDCAFDISDNYFTITSSTTAPKITRTLRKGVKGEDVKRLQKFLNLVIDGSFGSATQKKVMEWQSQNGLKVDGLFGSQSWEKTGLNN